METIEDFIFKNNLIILNEKYDPDEPKLSVPTAMKKAVWDKYVGPAIGQTKCFCCRKNDIRQLEFYCARVISRKNRGPDTIDNFRPICGRCNSSMYGENMIDYIIRYKLWPGCDKLAKTTDTPTNTNSNSTKTTDTPTNTNTNSTKTTITTIITTVINTVDPVNKVDSVKTNNAEDIKNITNKNNVEDSKNTFDETFKKVSRGETSIRFKNNAEDIKSISNKSNNAEDIKNTSAVIDKSTSESSSTIDERMVTGNSSSTTDERMVEGNIRINTNSIIIKNMKSGHYLSATEPSWFKFNNPKIIMTKVIGFYEKFKLQYNETEGNYSFKTHHNLFIRAINDTLDQQNKNETYEKFKIIKNNNVVMIRTHNGLFVSCNNDSITLVKNVNDSCYFEFLPAEPNRDVNVTAEVLNTFSELLGV